jgi:hypothetical protein
MVNHHALISVGPIELSNPRIMDTMFVISAVCVTISLTQRWAIIFTRGSEKLTQRNKKIRKYTESVTILALLPELLFA